MAQGDALDAAIKSYADKIRANPDSLVFVQLADGYRKKGDLDAALEACRTGLARHPHLLSGLLMHGRIHAARRQYPDAIESLKKVVQREPNNLTAHALLSQSYLSLGRWAEAIAEYQHILALNPEDNAAQNALQDALERMRRERVEGSRASPAVPAPAGTGGAAPSAAAPASVPSITVTAQPSVESGMKQVEDREAQVIPASRPAPPAMEVPAYAAAEELAERGLYDEAIEALQRILEADPDNFMARQKLREVYAQREAMESPAVGPEPASRAAGGGETHADKISDEEILYLLGIMEDAAGGPVAPAPAAPPAPVRPATAPSVPPAKTAVAVPAPVMQADAPTTPALTEPPAPVAVAAPAPVVGERGETPAPAIPTAGPAGRLQAEGSASRITDILGRLTGTEGLTQAWFVSGQDVVGAGAPPAGEQAAKIVMLVTMLSEVTRKAALGMKQGDVKQVVVFGTDGLVMVSPAPGGILAAVAGGGVRVGLLRLALNDCLKRLAEVN